MAILTPGSSHRAPTDVDDHARSPAAVFRTATIESLREQLGASGPGLLQELIGLYLVQARDLVGRIEDAVVDRDAPGRRSLAHKLRGSTATLGGDRLAAVCLRLETPEDRDDDLTSATVALRREFEALAVVLDDHRRALRSGGVTGTG